MFSVEAKGLEPSNLLTASQALYQLSYAPEDASTLSDLADAGLPAGFRILGHVGRRECLALTVRIGQPRLTPFKLRSVPRGSSEGATPAN